MNVHMQARLKTVLSGACVLIRNGYFTNSIIFILNVLKLMTIRALCVLKGQ